MEAYGDLTRLPEAERFSYLSFCTKSFLKVGNDELKRPVAGSDIVAEPKPFLVDLLLIREA